jgi:hypothetical protein
LPGKHRFVDREDLVGKRFDERRVNGEERVEQVGQLDAEGL